ncbi:MAG: dioxygenase [Vicinamibacteria bacterium]|nr:dioxygenase [Vicinamibacteria bacterium]
MRTVFVSHGAPTAALESGPYASDLRALGACWQGARALLVVSAHWEAPGAFRVTAADRPPVYHDFWGFPEELYRLDYPAAGDPALATRIVDLLRAAGLDAAADPQRPWDHGVWVPLRLARPAADLPVVQLSLPRPRTPALLEAAGAALRPLAAEGVILVGSGGIVHNLPRLHFGDEAAPVDGWARGFDDWVGARVESGRGEEVFAYREAAPDADLAVPTSEHFDPLFVALGYAGPQAKARTVHASFKYGSLSLRSFAWD